MIAMGIKAPLTDSTEDCCRDFTLLNWDEGNRSAATILETSGKPDSRVSKPVWKAISSDGYIKPFLEADPSKEKPLKRDLARYFDYFGPPEGAQGVCWLDVYFARAALNRLLGGQLSELSNEEHLPLQCARSQTKEISYGEWQEFGILSPNLSKGQGDERWRNDAKALIAYRSENLPFKYSLQVGNIEYHLSDVFLDPHTKRPACLMLIERDGERYLRVASMSNSQGLWRVVLALNHPSLVEQLKEQGCLIPGMDKGNVNLNLFLPYQVQAHLCTALTLNHIMQLEGEPADLVVPSSVRFNQTLTEHLLYQATLAMAGQQLVVDDFMLRVKPNDRLYSKSGSARDGFRPPHTVTPRNPDDNIDYDRLLCRYLTEVDAAGPCLAYCFSSLNGSLVYTLLVDREGVCWPGNVEYSEVGLNSWGVPDKIPESIDWMMPRFSYPRQIPPGFAGNVCARNPEYQDTRRYSDSIPMIVEFYKRFGQPTIPLKNN